MAPPQLQIVHGVKVRFLMYLEFLRKASYGWVPLLPNLLIVVWVPLLPNLQKPSLDPRKDFFFR